METKRHTTKKTMGQGENPLGQVKNHMIISVDTEKAFDKNSTSIYNKNSQQSEYREKITQ